MKKYVVVFIMLLLAVCNNVYGEDRVRAISALDTARIVQDSIPPSIHMQKLQEQALQSGRVGDKPSFKIKWISTTWDHNHSGKFIEATYSWGFSEKSKYIVFIEGLWDFS